MYDVGVSRLVAKEGGRFPFEFDQRLIEPEGKPVFPDQLGTGTVVQALLVAPERKRRVKIPAGTPEKPTLRQRRQSRVTAALNETTGDIIYRPAKAEHPDVGIIFDRGNIKKTQVFGTTPSSPQLSTVLRQKTTIPLSGLSSLEPTHRLFDPAGIHETVAVALSQGPSKFKLETLTIGDGGLSFQDSIKYYQAMLAQRLAAEIGTNPLAAETEPLTKKTGNSEDLLPKIPW